MSGLKPNALIGRDAPGCLGCRESLELCCDAERIEKIRNGQLNDLEALASPRFNEAYGCKPLQCLADRGSRDAVMLGELALIQPVAGLAGAMDDLPFEASNDFAGKGGASPARMSALFF